MVALTLEDDLLREKKDSKKEIYALCTASCFWVADKNKRYRQITILYYILLFISFMLLFAAIYWAYTGHNAIYLINTIVISVSSTIVCILTSRNYFEQASMFRLAQETSVYLVKHSKRLFELMDHYDYPYYATVYRDYNKVKAKLYNSLYRSTLLYSYPLIALIGVSVLQMIFLPNTSVLVVFAYTGLAAFLLVSVHHTILRKMDIAIKKYSNKYGNLVDKVMNESDNETNK